MNNIAENLNLIVDYIEKNLTEEIDKDNLAQIACCTYFDVARMFSLISGISISEYIRKRRLTFAGLELKEGHAKVIDVALKYGYDSHISFTRAFQAFHGVTPSALNKDGAVLKVFPRMIFKIQVKGVIDVLKKEHIKVKGKEYEASYFGEMDMSLWSSEYSKRQYWRLENSYEDLKNKFATERLLPYNNYPSIEIEKGQVFVIDYHTKTGKVERKYYIADGTIWQDMPSTREIVLEGMKPIRKDVLTVGGKEYEASYFGSQNMSYWSSYANERKFWRLENVGEEFEGCRKLREVLPYNNYPPIEIEQGQIFVVDYYTKNGDIERKYYVADGTIWQEMPSTREFEIKE